MSEHRTRAELEGDGTEFGVANPVLPFPQIPHAAGHEDGNVVANTARPHLAAQLANPRVRRLGPVWILGIAEAVVAAREPRILVNNATQKLLVLVVGALPQGLEGACGRYDGIVIDAVLRGDLGRAIRHPGAARNSVDQALRPLQHAVQHPRSGRGFPQDIHVKAPTAVGALIGQLCLGDAALDRVRHQLLALVGERDRVDLEEPLLQAAGLDVAVACILRPERNVDEGVVADVAVRVEQGLAERVLLGGGG